LGTRKRAFAVGEEKGHAIDLKPPSQVSSLLDDCQSFLPIQQALSLSSFQG
jgi:hypothetical protein